ncbi:MAG: ParB family transcriptional regulator, chromosome partitioning protein [Pseudonocardiales bacterium]|nr:ParB family transcriptional regulator, chromosome partitioning protein [Pseudonocardiales bacterium]
MSDRSTARSAHKARRGGLGRGLGALIPTAPAPDQAARPGPADVHFGAASADTPDREPERETAAPDASDGPLPVPGATYAELPIASVHPNAKQPRQVFDEDALAELAHSVREFGVLQPVVVRADAAGGYELVMGERRLRAAAAAGLETIPAIVRSTADDAMLRDALLENIHRAQLNPLEEAAAYQQLLEEFGTTHEELAQRIGRSRPQVSNTIRLLNLPIPVQRRVAAGVLSAGHARALLGLDDKDLQDELAARIVAEGLSVRATEELVALSVSGHGDKKHTRRAPSRISAPGITELAERLSDAFDTRVRVELGRRKGKITVEFASVDDLERLVAVMAPQLATQRADATAQPEPNEP